MNTITKRMSVWALVVAAILLIPYLGNAPWTTMDYVFASVVLLSSASSYEIITERMKDKIHRIGVGIAVLAVVVLIWGWAVA
jgi:hypothetical protein